MVVLGLTGCGSSARDASSSQVETVDPTPSAVQLVDVPKASALAADPSVVVVDVRTPAEFAAGHIGRAELVDFEAPGFAQRIAQLDHSATYLVYCHSGNRSGQATAIMATLGFTNVNNLAGGISAWQAAGAPLVK
jgi:rhodanese-related sulfurtransferase